MFSFLSRMRLPGFTGPEEGEHEQAGLPPPATHKYQDRPSHRRGDSGSSITSKDGKLHLNTLAISAPIPRSSPSSITGFDNDNLPFASGGNSSSVSLSSGSAVTAYQYHHLPTSFSSLHQQQQQSAFPGQRFYQNPAFSQSAAQVYGHGQQPRAGPSRTWPPSEIGVAIGGEDGQEDIDMDGASLETQARYHHSQFPAVVRLDSGDYSYVHGDRTAREYAADQIGRSASAPPSETYLQRRIAQQQASPYAVYGPGSGSSSNPSLGRFNLRLNLDANAAFAQGVQSLRLPDHTTVAAATDVFAGAYDYPGARQLSPIAEVDYVSPDSLKKTKSLPFIGNSSEISATPYSRQNTNNTTNTTNPSPGGSPSQGSEVTRPSPVYSSPFITRTLNRTVSQTSSRTHVSTASSVPTRITTATGKSNEPPPTLPPIDLRPPFPGPHPSQSGAPIRGPKQQRTIGGLSTIIASDEGGTHPEGSRYTGDDGESFVTASSHDRNEGGNGIPPIMPDDSDRYEGEEGDAASSIHQPQPSLSGDSRADLGSLRSGHSQRQSGSESFIARRWESDAGYGSGGRVTVLRSRKQAWLNSTPAFWAFWLGFVCPFLWLIGGWHFTNFGEQPPRLSFWEFYFNAGFWKDMIKSCFGRRKKEDQEPEEPVGQRNIQEAMQVAPHGNQRKDKQRVPVPPPVTRWVTEKQSSEQRRERLYDPKRSMRGISFGYPFIPRPISRPPGEDWAARASRLLQRIVATPNRLFDQLYGVRLMEVRGRPETRRRMFDPWIQRCRYAFCYALIMLSIGLCTTSTYLIIYNTRQLR